MRTDVLIIILILASAIVFLWVKLHRSHARRKKLEHRLNEIANKTSVSGLDSIEARLNPHLLKNILNSIQAHAYQTYFSLDKLANVLDYILYESRGKFVSAKEEIAFALNLIESTKSRSARFLNCRSNRKSMNQTVSTTSRCSLR